ncbi:MAG: GNAT family N-acetyltransferase [Eubacteriales bacterium]|nr:GNAT family N-acetyltransferase [Eubacteriales bacterium]
MQYRAITQSEYADYVDMQAQAFFFSVDREKLRTYAREEGGEHHLNGRAAFTPEGTMAACLTLIPFEQYFEGQLVGMGGIGGVCTRPEYRRQGHIRELFRLIFREMYDRGDVLSYLYPFSMAYYRQFGYEAAGASHHLSIPFSALAHHRLSASVQPFMPEIYADRASDPEPIVEIYEKWAAGYNLMVSRDGGRWQRLLERDPANDRWRTFLLRDSCGEPLAYVVFSVKDETLLVEDAAWAWPEGLGQICAFLAGMGGAGLKTLKWQLCSYLSPELITADWMPEQAKRETIGMNRIINARSALELLRRPGLPGAVTLRLEDPWLPENNDLFRVSLADAAVEPRSDGPADLELSIAAASALFTGYVSLDEALLRTDVHLRAQHDALTKLFPKKPVFIRDSF